MHCIDAIKLWSERWNNIELLIILQWIWYERDGLNEINYHRVASGKCSDRSKLRASYDDNNILFPNRM